jgi:hypothetical protein
MMVMMGLSLKITITKDYHDGFMFDNMNTCFNCKSQVGRWLRTDHSGFPAELAMCWELIPEIAGVLICR